MPALASPRKMMLWRWIDLTTVYTRVIIIIIVIFFFSRPWYLIPKGLNINENVKTNL
jgi:hypothetical protein